MVVLGGSHWPPAGNGGCAVWRKICSLNVKIKINVYYTIMAIQVSLLTKHFKGVIDNIMEINICYKIIDPQSF